MSPVVDVEEVDHPALSIGGGRRGVDAAGRDPSVVEASLGDGSEPVGAGVVIPQEVLAPEGVAERQEQVLGADRDEVRAGGGIAEWKGIGLDQAAQAGPVDQIPEETSPSPTRP